MVYDVCILGGGPAGLSCGLYLSRAGYKVMLFEQMFTGGQAATTDVIENYPGVPNVSGPEFAMLLSDQATAFGLEIKYTTVESLDILGDEKKVYTTAGDFACRGIVCAMGAAPKELDVPGAARLRGKGVSFCATCDGALFKGKRVAVVGGGDTAVEDALYLSRFAGSICVIHRRDRLRAEGAAVARLEKLSNIEFAFNSVVDEITGENRVEGINIKSTADATEYKKEVDGVFIAIGTSPNSQLVSGVVNTDANGYIIAGEDCRTSVRGVYAIGDIRTKPLRQVVTAAADGAVAAQSVTQDILQQ